MGTLIWEPIGTSVSICYDDLSWFDNGNRTLADFKEVIIGGNFRYPDRVQIDKLGFADPYWKPGKPA